MQHAQTEFFRDQGANPIAVVFLVIGCVITCLSTRRNAIRALFAVALFFPLAQQFGVFGFHLHFFRVLLLFGLFRCMARGEHRGWQICRIDKLVTFWALAILVGGLLRGSAEGFGAGFNSLGTYFLFRCLNKDTDDVVEALRFLALISLVMSAFMFYEAVTHHNLFSFMGGVPATDDLRDGRARAQGAFRHAILAGTFGATLIPLMLGLGIEERRSRLRAAVGIIAGVVITITAVSSGALMTLLAACAGTVFWKFRDRMYLFRRATVVILVVLSLVMKAPVWSLIAKVSKVAGGGGWHRAMLLDQFFGHFSQWCFIGTSYTASWSPSGMTLPDDPNNMDITNHYVSQGVHGGLAALCLFLMMIVACYKAIGNLWRTEADTGLKSKFYWMLGVALTCHCTAFISVSYFDQSIVFWFWLLATISFLSQRAVSLQRLGDAEGEPPIVEGIGEQSPPLTA